MRHVSFAFCGYLEGCFRPPPDRPEMVYVGDEGCMTSWGGRLGSVRFISLDWVWGLYAGGPPKTRARSDRNSHLQTLTKCKREQSHRGLHGPPQANESPSSFID